ncbi:putative LRR receptor-like serine/threonine-protein kinase IRK [Sesamum alatum]|uniref:LRR receptor-like serine/threonine-protein kinase IRK n=1 Tax=Sesamum alatum TaxID=300844 RepID=A0AAE1YNY9_9LAMI|nr:putative LRR receptor-like serine/threonine-protein kinase IRK [Sesamum alatum]
MRSLLGVFFFIFLSPFLVKSLSPSLSDDVLGLIVLKADIRDPDGKLSSWNEDDDSPCNNWIGVKCNPRSNRVSELVLDGFGLSGKLGRGLLQLQFLQKLSLAKNNLTGSLSLSLAQLSDLRVLDLSENGLTGSMSTDFFVQCGSLRSISLARNKFSGPIPESLGSCAALTSLNFSGNQFLGPLPSTIWSMPVLKSLDLSDNMLEGEIPQNIEGLNNLRVIRLRNNKFTGEVPDGIGNCLLLRSIDLSQNLLSGGLPRTMQKLSLCNVLLLARNQFTWETPEWIGEMRSLETIDLSENNFTGQLPDSLGKLQSLKILNVSKNALTGSLPETMSNCINLVTFDISHNSLTGNLPSWLFKLGLEQVLFSDNRLSGSIDNAFTSSTDDSQKKLVILDISRNDLSGAIPAALGDFGSLQFLNMSMNSFLGSILADIGQLKKLSILELSYNKLNGSIPSELGGLSSLDEMRLEKNSLGGEIPLSIGNCASLKSLYLAHNEITGSVPASLAKLSNLHIVDLCFNKLTGTLPKQLENLVRLQLFNISHNQVEGELPAGGFFNTISPLSVSGNPSLCGAAINRSCPTVLPKPIVLNPNSTDATPGTIPQTFGRGKKILSIFALIAIGAAAAIVIGVIAITVLNFRVRSSMSRSAVALTFSGGDDFRHSPSTDGSSGKLVMFSGDPDFSTGAQYLLNKNCELGRGGFGSVYRTTLKDGRSVAIKKLTVSSLVKSQEEFEREVKKLGKVRHVNLVALDGYYWTPSLQLLIYEYVPGGNLYKRLHEGSGGNYLSWNERFNIILGAAKGLAHLHQMKVIHYNLKSSNILIDSSGEPKVADYGLARLLPMLDRYVLSSKIQSALGYMAPEFACKTVKITEKCDVYGFGILVLEIVTGKRPVEYMEDDVVVLCDMVRGSLEEGKVEECVDDRLQEKFPAEEAIQVTKLGLICTSQVPSNRPDMAEVVNILELIRCPS